MSALQSGITTIETKDYVTLVILTAVVYDYILTFLDEIEYIWSMPRTRVSTLFVFARYFGLCDVITYAFLWNSFRPGSEILIAKFEWLIFGIFDTWASFIFIGAAQLVMILRVWALYHRSAVILGALLALYIIEFILYFAASMIVSMQSQSAAATIQVLDFSFCKADNSLFVWSEIMNYIQLILGTLMCLLIATQFMKQSLRMYEVTKQFQLDCYVNLISREGIIYFIFVLTCAAVTLNQSINLPMDGWAITLLAMVEYIPTITLVPRFILCLRKLYAHDIRRQCGDDIDSAFGLSSTCEYGAALSMIVFEDVGQNEELEQDEEIQMEEIHSAGDSGV